jgi:hypothetical protein
MGILFQHLRQIYFEGETQAFNFFSTNYEYIADYS